MSTSKMAASRYKKFLALCERWPLDKSKTDRDLGFYIRQRVAAAFPQGDASRVQDEQECDRTYNALNRIATDEARRKYPRLKGGTVTGLTAEDCRLVSSSEGQELQKQKQQPFFKKLANTFGGGKDR